MTKIDDRLDEIRALADAATEGPWETFESSSLSAGCLGVNTADDTGADMVFWHHGYGIAGGLAADATFTVAARTVVPELVAALRAVLAEVATFESLVRDDIGDAGIPAWGDGYLRGYHDAATDIREAITAALDVTP